MHVNKQLVNNKNWSLKCYKIYICIYINNVICNNNEKQNMEVFTGYGQNSTFLNIVQNRLFLPLYIIFQSIQFV